MFTGSMVAIVTPMHEDGVVDFDTLDALVDFHLENNTDVIIPAGTTGESATLDHDEHCEVIKRVVEKVKGRVPVIGGTGANSTWEAISLTRCAAEVGVDACLQIAQDDVHAATVRAPRITPGNCVVPYRSATRLPKRALDREAGVVEIEKRAHGLQASPVQDLRAGAR